MNVAILSRPVRQWSHRFAALHSARIGTSSRTGELQTNAPACSESRSVSGGEGPTLLPMLDRLVPQLPGTQALVYDGGIRGTHMNEILVRNGILPIVPSPGSRADQAPPPRRLEETRDGVQLYTQLGGLGIGHLTEDGDIAFERLRRCNIIRRQNSDRSFRWYGEYEQPDGRGTRTRLDQTAQDILCHINRAEHLRPIAKGDEG